MAKSGEAVSPVVSKIIGTAREVETRINGLKKPEMKFPLRTLANAEQVPETVVAHALVEHLGRGEQNVRRFGLQPLPRENDLVALD